MSADELAQTIRTLPQNISRWERGEPEKISFVAMALIAKELGVPIDALASIAELSVVPDKMSEELTELAAMTMKRTINYLADLKPEHQDFVAMIDLLIEGDRHVSKNASNPVKVPEATLPGWFTSIVAAKQAACNGNEG